MSLSQRGKFNGDTFNSKLYFFTLQSLDVEEENKKSQRNDKERESD